MESTRNRALLLAGALVVSFSVGCDEIEGPFAGAPIAIEASVENA